MSTAPELASILPFRHPTQTFITHLSPASDPPYGSWTTADQVIFSGQQAATQQLGTRTENYLDHLIALRFLEQDAGKLSQLAQRVGTKLRPDGSPFGTTFYLKFDLPIDSDTWHVTFDGFHLMASRPLAADITPDVNLFDGRLPEALLELLFPDDFPEDDLDHLTSHVSWEWTHEDAARNHLSFPGILYRLHDHHLSVPGHAMTLKWAGGDARANLPYYLAEIISLWLRADRLHLLLQETTNLSLTLELPSLPSNPTLNQQTAALQGTQGYWDDFRRTVPRFDQQGKLVGIARDFMDASKSFEQYGLSRRHQNQARRIIYGPFPATTALADQPGMRQLTVSSMAPEDAPAALNFLGLNYVRLQAVLRNVDAARMDYEKQASVIRELIGMDTSLLSAQTAVQNAKIASSAMRAAWAAAVLALVSGGAAILALLKQP